MRIIVATKITGSGDHNGKFIHIVPVIVIILAQDGFIGPTFRASMSTVTHQEGTVIYAVVNTFIDIGISAAAGCGYNLIGICINFMKVIQTIFIFEISVYV